MSVHIKYLSLYADFKNIISNNLNQEDRQEMKTIKTRVTKIVNASRMAHCKILNYIKLFKNITILHMFMKSTSALFSV